MVEKKGSLHVKKRLYPVKSFLGANIGDSAQKKPLEKTRILIKYPRFTPQKDVMASQSISTAISLPPIGFFEPVDQGDPLTRVQAVKLAADRLLSFGSSGWVLKFQQDQFIYVKADIIDKRLNPALKAVLCLALIAAPFARLLHALWTKRPINVTIALPLAIPVGIFLAKYSFRSNLASVPSRCLEIQKDAVHQETGLFRCGVLRSGERICRKGNDQATMRGLFDEKGNLLSGTFEDVHHNFYYVKPEVILDKANGLNFAETNTGIQACEWDAALSREGAAVYKKSALPLLEALFEIAKDPSRPSPIKTCTQRYEDAFKPLEVIAFLAGAEGEGSSPRFMQLSQKSVIEFVDLAVSKKHEISEDQIEKILTSIEDLKSKYNGLGDKKFSDELQLHAYCFSLES